MAEFKRLSDVEVVAEPAESANVLIEENGVIKKAPKTAVGGAGGEPDMVITLTGCPVSGTISTDIITITSGTVTDVFDKIWSGTPVDIRVRGSMQDGSYMATANEVKATAMYYGGALFVNWVCANHFGDYACVRRIVFNEDGTVSSVKNYKTTVTAQ